MKSHSSFPSPQLPSPTKLTLYILKEDLKARALSLSMENVGGLHDRWQVDLFPIFKALSGLKVSAEIYDQQADRWAERWMNKPQKSTEYFAQKWYSEMIE